MRHRLLAAFRSVETYEEILGMTAEEFADLFSLFHTLKPAVFEHPKHLLWLIGFCKVNPKRRMVGQTLGPMNTEFEGCSTTIRAYVLRSLDEAPFFRGKFLAPQSRLHPLHSVSGAPPIVRCAADTKPIYARLKALPEHQHSALYQPKYKLHVWKLLVVIDWLGFIIHYGGLAPGATSELQVWTSFLPDWLLPGELVAWDGGLTPSAPFAYTPPNVYDIQNNPQLSFVCAWFSFYRGRVEHVNHLINSWGILRECRIDYHKLENATVFCMEITAWLQKRRPIRYPPHLCPVPDDWNYHPSEHFLRNPTALEY